MKKHIFALAIITLTVGCRPNSSSSLQSQNETNTVPTLEKHIGTTSDRGLEKISLKTDASPKADLLAHLSEMTYDATLRLQLEVTHIQNPSQKIALLQKLLSLKGGPNNLTILAALRQSKIDLNIQNNDLKETPEQDRQIEAIALAYKEIARIYGLNSADQDLIYKTIRNSSELLAPTVAQKVLMKTSMEVIQSKATELARALIADDATKLDPTLKVLITSVQNFMAKDSSYVLPSSLSEATNDVRVKLIQIHTSFAIDPLQGKALLGKLLPQIIENINSLEQSLSQYLTPQVPVAPPNILRTMEMGVLKETKEFRLSQGLTAEGMLELKDVDCRTNGQRIIFIPMPPTLDLLQATSDLTVKGQKPFFARKIKNQRGLSFGVIHKDFRITSQKGMSPATTEKGEPALVVTLIPRENQSFEFTYKEGNSTHKVSCSTK
ncbi:MAG: hypothetical protein ACM3MG_02300 [Bacillota bacterium]